MIARVLPRHVAVPIIEQAPPNPLPVLSRSRAASRADTAIEMGDDSAETARFAGPVNVMPADVDASATTALADTADPADFADTADTAWFSPETRAILNTFGVSVGKTAVTTAVNSFVYWVIASPGQETNESDSQTTDIKTAIASTVAATAIGYAFMKGIKVVLSPCVYRESSTERVAEHGEVSFAVKGGRALMHPGVRYAVTAIAGCVGGLFATFSGCRVVGSPKEVYTTFAALTPAVTDSLIDYALKPHVTTYKTSADFRPQLTASTLKLLPTMLISMKGESVAITATNLALRGVGAATLSALTNTTGTVEAPKPRGSAKALLETVLGKCAVNASAGLAAAKLARLPPKVMGYMSGQTRCVTPDQASTSSGDDWSGVKAFDEVQLAEVGANVAAASTKALKGPLEKVTAKVAAHRHDMQEKERRVRENALAGLRTERLSIGGDSDTPSQRSPRWEAVAAARQTQNTAL